MKKEVLSTRNMRQIMYSKSCKACMRFFFCLFAARMMKAFKTFGVTQHQQSFLTQITMLLLNSQHLPQNSSTTFSIPDTNTRYIKAMKNPHKCTFLAALNVLIPTPLYKWSGDHKHVFPHGNYPLFHLVTITINTPLWLKLKPNNLIQYLLIFILFSTE